jgi:hypothetical protein
MLETLSPTRRNEALGAAFRHARVGFACDSLILQTLRPARQKAFANHVRGSQREHHEGARRVLGPTAVAGFW